MPAQVKVNGAWRTATGLSAKVDGQWKTVTSAYTKIGGTWRQWYASKIQDSFNRTSTSSGLGSADSGQPWTALRGNWRVGGSNNAISDDSASSYPIASINLGSSNISAKVEVSEGTGIAFWVSDSANWFGAVVYGVSTPYTYSCNPYSCNPYSCSYQGTCYTSPSYSCACGNATSGRADTMNCACGNGTSGYYQSTSYSVFCGSSCTACSGQCANGRSAGCTGCIGTAPARECYGNCYETVWVPGTADTMNCACGNGIPASGDTMNCACPGTGGSPYSCTITTTCYNTCYQTCSGTQNTYYLRLISSVSGAVSTVGSDISLPSMPASISVLTSNNSITVTAYSDAAGTSQVGSQLTRTPSSPILGTSTGIIKAPTAISQGSTTDSFIATLNI